MKTIQTTLNSPRYPYQFQLTGSFTNKEETLIQTCFERFFEVVGSGLSEGMMVSGICIQVEAGSGNNFRLPYKVCLNPRGLTGWTVTHELGHALDASYRWGLSKKMQAVTSSYFPWLALHLAHANWRLFWYRVGDPPPPCGVDKNFNPREDFAETVTAFIFPEEACRRAEMRGYPYEKWGYAHFHDTPRGMFMKGLIADKERETPSS